VQDHLNQPGIREASPAYDASLPIELPTGAIRRFCETWGVSGLALFGSVLTPEFGDASDVDVLVEFKPAVSHSVREYFAMVRELEAIFGRRVDLLDRRTLVNPFRRASILANLRPIYAA